MPTFFPSKPWISFEINNSLPRQSYILRTLSSLNCPHPDPPTAAQARFLGSLHLLHPCILRAQAHACRVPPSPLFLSWGLKLNKTMKKGSGSDIHVHQTRYWFLPPTAYFLLGRGCELSFNLYKIQLVEESESLILEGN